ncbi:MAG: hypothetical protein CL949_20605 [Erythrobacter sp.]|nr:hypothetical protein [Erythrobacter sp.]|tara:strand:+ start:53 stop:370 length:318 start_codon:yes stop_codon:yes gene_type:complete
MQGVCQQRHFPAVAQPFRVLWAPWAPSLFFTLTGLLLSVLMMALVSQSLGAFILPIGLVGGHVIAIIIGLRMQFMVTLIAGIENVRRGSTNLTSQKTGAYEFANI